MKVVKFLTGLVLLASAAGAGLYYAGPAVRAKVDHKVQLWIGWTEEARRADPVGFANHVQGRLEADLEGLESTRGDLIAEASQVSRTLHEQQALLQHAEQLAEEFRQAYREAKEHDAFPVIVRNSAYTEEQVLSQVSLLLAEADGYRRAIAKLQQLAAKADERLQELTVRIDSTQVQLAALGTQRELLRAEVLTVEGEKLVTHLDRLFETNQQVVHGNPVRSVSELLATPEKEAEQRPGIDVARRFLAAQPQVDVPVADVHKGDSEPTPDWVILKRLMIDATVAECDPSPRDDPAPTKKTRKAKRSAAKPIFTQN